MHLVFGKEGSERETIESEKPYIYIYIAAHGCTGVFYVTQQCVVRCGAHYYDPCLCATELCSNIVFQQATCASGRLAFDPLAVVADEKMLLYSMNWPTTLPPNEGGAVRVDELNQQLARIHASAAHVTFDDASVLPAMAALIAQQQPADETAVPRAHCDDLLDYFDAHAQHPVGYHPTCACLRAETQMRGFDAWMSVPHGSARA